MNPAPAPQLVHEVPDVDLGGFERLVYSGMRAEAGEELVRILQRLKIGGQLAGPRLGEPGSRRNVARLASAVSTLISDPKARFSQLGYERLMAEHSTFHAVFRASAFGSADHLLGQFLQREGPGSGDASVAGVDNMAKVLLCYSLDSRYEVDLGGLLRAQPMLALPSVLALVSGAAVLSMRGHERREQVLKLAPLLEGAELPDSLLTLAQRAYMHCSYATNPDKHDFKRALNVLTCRLLGRLFEPPRTAVREPRKARPALLVPLEWFHTGHAMYRCYAPMVEALRPHFHLVGMAHEGSVDPGSKALFHQFVELRGGDVMLSEVLAHVSAIKPDMVWYPSVGMAWCAALSTIRLAPVQLATMGHPATTKSEVIDYAVLSEFTPGGEGTMSESVLLARGMWPMVKVASERFPQRLPERRPGILRIAVPAMVAKLNAPFLALCRSIAQESRRSTEFHFFPNVEGLERSIVDDLLGHWVKGAVSHPRLSYNEYLERLSRCHLHLSPFPFGGTNSNLDSMRMGIPMVAFVGSEVHSQTDAAMMRHAGLPDSLVARTEEEYRRIALRLIDDDDERLAVSAQLRSTDIEQIFFNPVHARMAEDFPRVVRWCFEEHEAIAASGRRYWSVEDRGRRFPRFSP